MNCKNVNKKLIFYIENDLPDNEAVEIQKHLSECKQCRAKYHFLKQTLAEIEYQKNIKANPFIATRILSRTADTTQKYRLKKALSSVLIALFLLFAIFLGKKSADFYYNNSIKNQVTNISQDTLDMYVLKDFDYSSYYYIENQ